MFIQQSLNVEEMPFRAGANNKEFLRVAAVVQLMDELKNGAASVKKESDWVSEKEMFAEFDVEE